MNMLAHANRWRHFIWSAMLVATLLAPGMACAQVIGSQITGAWRLVEFYNEENGLRTNTYGEKPMGLTIYDRSGYVTQFLSKPDLPRFAIPNRLKGTDAEYRAVMQSVLSGFGTYTVDGNTVSIQWISSSYPNRIGTTEKRSVTITGDEMTVSNPMASSGGSSYSKYVRAK